ncbi:hypothetical protein [Paenibacillus tarimensis]|nr:hypothetical protein [Paenibacillus tarimensis]
MICPVMAFLFQGSANHTGNIFDPKVCVSVVMASTPALTEQMQKEDIDFAICSVPQSAPALYLEPLYNEAFIPEPQAGAYR